MTGVVHVNHAGTWKALNFGAALIHVKHSGTWKVPTGVWVKHSGTWKKVYPSDLEAWTTATIPTTDADRQVSSTAQPQLSTDPTYTYRNILAEGYQIRWQGQQTLVSDGHWVRGWGFGWTPVTSAGFEYGAVTRIEMSMDALALQAASGSDSYRIAARPNSALMPYSTANLTTSKTLYTFDYTVAAWDITDLSAGRLHTSPHLTHSIRIAPSFDNGAGATTDQAAVETVKCRIKYQYN